jgi:thiopurine S-methyltransferase
MEHDFWHERWAKDEIGFHQHDFNTHMQAFADRLALNPGDHVLVPLCGKSLDMLWLLKQGYRVSGIELSRKAVEDFFAENQLQADMSEIAGGLCFSSGDLDIYCADFFEFDFERISPFNAIYDRASLIALPPDMRLAYTDRISAVSPAGTPSLLVTLDYPAGEMRGPPFSVPDAEVRQLYGSAYRIEHLHSEDCLAQEPRFRKKGVTRMDEHVYLLNRL